HRKFWSAPQNLEWIGASLRLVHLFHEVGGERAVIAGTCAEYDWAGDCRQPLTHLRPHTLYGASKDALRRIVCAYARERDLSVAWARIFFVYGPHEQPGRLVAAAARSFVAGERFAAPDGRQRRDLLYVDDVADA